MSAAKKCNPRNLLQPIYGSCGHVLETFITVDFLTSVFLSGVMKCFIGVPVIVKCLTMNDLRWD